MWEYRRMSVTERMGWIIQIRRSGRGCLRCSEGSEVRTRK